VTDQGLAWDYTAQAAHYEARAPYHPDTLAAAVAAGAPAAGQAVDIGAGTARFARMLAAAGYAVEAVEPNAAMRAIGRALAPPTVRWHDARGEALPLPAAACDVASFASSFNVVASGAALDEAARVLRPGGALLVLWNHRRLDDPLQAAVERAIREIVPGFAPGRRREDPAPTIDAHPAFEPACAEVLSHRHQTTPAAFVEGFRAHATVVRQAGTQLPRVLAAIAALVDGATVLQVPFETRLWIARRRPWSSR
jgi:SAM-dependent methyltransferase